MFFHTCNIPQELKDVADRQPVDQDLVSKDTIPSGVRQWRHNSHLKVWRGHILYR